MTIEQLCKANEINAEIEEILRSIKSLEESGENFLIGHKDFQQDGVYYPEKFTSFSELIGSQAYFSLCRDAKTGLITELRKQLKMQIEEFAEL